MEKKYWKGMDELSNDAEFVRLKNNEFYEHLPIDEVISNDSDGQRELHSIAIRIWDGRRSAIRSIRFAASASKF